MSNTRDSVDRNQFRSENNFDPFKYKNGKFLNPNVNSPYKQRPAKNNFLD